MRELAACLPPRVALLSELEAVAPEEAEADIIDGLVVAVDMLARRTARWVGGGWAGPNFEHSVSPRPDELDSLPQGFGRAQVAGLPRERELASRLAEEAGVGARFSNPH